MRRNRFACWCALSLCLTAACEEDKADKSVTNKPPSATIANEVQKSELPENDKVIAAPKQSPIKVISVSGTSALFKKGAAIKRGATVRTGGEQLTVDLGKTQVVVLPNSVLTFGKTSELSVILGQGDVWVTASPEGGSARAELRVATPSGAVVIPASASLWVSVFDNGKAWSTILSGVAQILTPSGPPLVLRSGQAAAVGSQASTKGPKDIDGAKAIATTLHKTNKGQQPSLDQFVKNLDAVIRTQQELRQQGDALAAAHRKALVAKDSQGAGLVQKKIVEHSGQRLTGTETLRLRFELAHARTLTESHGDGGDPVAQRRPRVRGLLGLQ